MELPEKEYFKIKDVALRWKCSQDDVLHLIENNKLVPVFNFKSVECRKLIPDGKGWADADPLLFKGKVVPFRVIGLWKMSNIRRFWSKYFPITTEWEGELAGQVFHADDKDAPFFKSFRVQVAESWKVTAADLLITLDEVLRFEAEHTPTSAVPEPAPHAPSTPIKKGDKVPKDKRRRPEEITEVLAYTIKSFEEYHDNLPADFDDDFMVFLRTERKNNDKYLAEKIKEIGSGRSKEKCILLHSRENNWYNHPYIKRRFNEFVKDRRFEELQPEKEPEKPSSQPLWD